MFILITALWSAAAVGHGDIDGLIAAATAEIAKQPDNAELLMRRGELHAVHEDWVAANTDFDRAAKLAPGLIGVDFCRGKMLLAAKKSDAAVEALDRFIKAKADSPEAFIIRARAKAHLAKGAEAIADFTKAIDLSARPEPEYYIERARLQEPAVAIRGLDEGIAKLGLLVTLVLPAIEQEVALKRYDVALERLERFTATMPRKDMWMARRADILVKANRAGEALPIYQAALAAIEALPPRNRQATATNELKAHIEAQLKALEIVKPR